MALVGEWFDMFWLTVQYVLVIGPDEKCLVSNRHCLADGTHAICKRRAVNQNMSNRSSDPLTTKCRTVDQHMSSGQLTNKCRTVNQQMSSVQ